MLSEVRIVLVQTFHPGNIGSAARVMKNMGLSDLFLVSPVEFPSADALKMAAGAEDVVHQAKVVSSVAEAVQGCHLVMACTARPRDFDLPVLNAEEAAQLGAQQARSGKVALLFGPERFGLSNDDLSEARYRITIPTSPTYPSLNLASAVQVLSYEVFKAFQVSRESSPVEKARDLPSSEEVALFYAHLESTLIETGFINQRHPGNIMKKLRRLFDRAEPDAAEMNILRGILASIDRKTTRE